MFYVVFLVEFGVVSCYLLCVLAWLCLFWLLAGFGVVCLLRWPLACAVGLGWWVGVWVVLVVVSGCLVFVLLMLGVLIVAVYVVVVCWLLLLAGGRIVVCFYVIGCRLVCVVAWFVLV